eukprot:scaffold10225_cov146-Isochrysis_galbana.AAC.2
MHTTARVHLRGYASLYPLGGPKSYSTLPPAALMRGDPRTGVLETACGVRWPRLQSHILHVFLRYRRGRSVARDAGARRHRLYSELAAKVLTRSQHQAGRHALRPYTVL